MKRKFPGAVFLAKAALPAAAAALLLVPAAQRTAFYLPVEVLADLLILVFVLGRPARDRSLAFAVAMLLLADATYALKYFWDAMPILTFRIMLVAYVLYNLAGVRYLFRAYRASFSGEKSGPALLAALFAVFAALQLKYVAMPAAAGAYASLYTSVFVTAHRLVESALLALAVLLGMRARSAHWLLTLNAFTLLPLSSFAIGYNGTVANGVPYAEYGWVLGLFSLLAAQFYPAVEEDQFARRDSVRVRLVWFVCSVSALLLALLYGLQAFAGWDTFSLTSSLFFLLYGVWLVSNLIAFRVSEDIRSLLRSVEGPAAAGGGRFSLALHETDLFAEKLRAAYDTIRRQSSLAARAELAEQVAHDIRSPLAALDTVLKDPAGMPEDRRELLLAAAARIKSIAEDLRKKDARGRPAQKAERLLPLAEIVLKEKLLQFAALPGLKLELRPEAGAENLSAAVPEAEFCRALSNLLNNAVEAAGAEGRVEVVLGQKEKFASLAVTDDGPGIPPELLERLGRRGETHGKAGGSGLGLYQARKMAEACGGSLAINSAPGRTTVTILLPAAAQPR